MRQVFRFSSPKHLPWTSSGREGRWNRDGLTLIYAAESRALAKLEVLANQPTRLVHTLSRCQIPASLARKAPKVESLPGTKEACQELATAWVARARSPVMFVPSVILPAESNVLMNPEHPQFGELQWEIEAEAFTFDPRLHWMPAIYDEKRLQFFVSKREAWGDGRRFKPVASSLSLDVLFQAYRAQEDLKAFAASRHFAEQDLLEALAYGLRLGDFQ